MGRLFLDHIGGRRPVSCVKCKTPVTNTELMESNAYVGSSGKACLYARATNLTFGPMEERAMITGKHYVRDAFCKSCNSKLGWIYEMAVPKEQAHKEGKVILEVKYITDRGQ